MIKKKQNKKQKFLEPEKSHRPGLRAFLGLFRQEWGRVLLSIPVFLVKHAPYWLLPIFMSKIINASTAGGENALKLIITNSLIMLVILVQNIFSHTAYIYLTSRISRNIEVRLRTALITRLQQLSIGFYNNFRSGKIQSKVLRDVENIEMLVRQISNTVIQGITNVIFAITVTLMNQPVIALFYIGVIPLSVALIRTFRGGMKRRNQVFRKELETMTANVSEMVEMMPVTRAHGLEKHELKKAGSQLSSVRKKGLRLDILNGIFGASAWVAFGVFQMICLAFTSYLYSQGRFPVGNVVMYQFFFGMIQGGVMMIVNIFPQITKGMESLRSVDEILSSKDIENNKGKKKILTTKGEFEFHNISFSYNRQVHALKNFNLKVRSGECIAVIGESGAGKSTLMNLIIGFYHPSEGSLLLDKKDLKELDLRTYRKHLAVVPQSTILFSGTVRENVTYGLNKIKDETIISALQSAQAWEFIKEIPGNLNATIGEHGNTLSGGQRQRLAIARALIRNPRIIILDEATSSLDVESEKQVQLAIKALIKGRTTFIVAHRYSTIRFSHKIVFLKKGKITEYGTEKTLLSKRGDFYKWKKMQI